MIKPLGVAMDAKVEQLVRALHSKFFSAVEFTETDVVSLLILLRDEAGKHVRELADFVAHRERDRGRLQEFPREFDRIAALPPGKRPRSVSGPLQIADVRDDLNRQFGRLGLDPLADMHGELLFVMAASVLHGVTFTYKGTHIRRFKLKTMLFGYDPKFVGLYGVGEGGTGEIEFRLCGGRNHWFEVPASVQSGIWHPSPGMVPVVTLRRGRPVLEERAAAA